MILADGYLNFDTKIDTTGFEKGMQVLGKAAAVTSGVIAAGLGYITKEATESFAEYEQLVGGVQTLFKDNANELMAYADAAYQTAGMSANAYMETVTSFSASLIQSLDGDTKAATEAANQAIIDMSDNANKMGTDMELIQNAYQGFAKQNYTMLDNLKLGYGGTEAEMQRLLTDAEKISGIKYDISSFADITAARTILGFEPKWSFSDGIGEFVKWVNAQEVQEDKYEASIEEMKRKGLYK